ncbi:MAG: YitT family protein [Lachnospiraceae bacterium]|nr:YitT family protein [Lachnospiraceae bacterium]
MNTFIKKILPILLILFGNMIYGLGVVLFVLPTGLITGGTTGLGLFFQHSLGISLNIFIAVFNVIMFLLGAWILGKKFAITTIVSTFFYPLAFQVMTSLVGDTVLTTDPMLSTVCAGIMIGAGIGLVIRAGASTGGMDIPPLVLNKLFGVPVSVGLYAFDFLILILQILFSNTEQVLYGIMMIFIYTFVLDRILVIGNSRVEVKIVSPRYEEINQRIQSELDRGVTLLDVQGGHLRQESRMVLSVLSNRELVALNNLVTDIDPKAFMIVSQVKEVRGRGFTLDKKYGE